MSYLKIQHIRRMIFDPSDPNIEFKTFPKYDWREFYGDVTEAIPKGIELRMFVDSNHVGRKLTRHSWTGMLIFLNVARNNQQFNPSFLVPSLSQ